jgi:endoglucanase
MSAATVRTLIAAAVAAVLSMMVVVARGFAADAPASLDAFDQVHAMGRGINVLGYDPIWSDPASARFRPAHFTAIARGGFHTVRINLQAFGHMDAEGRLDPRWLATLDRLVKAALDRGLTVVLDEHDSNLCAEDAARCEMRLTAFWSQIAPHFQTAPDRVLFELLNEPNGRLDDAAWNRLLAVELAEVRKTNPTRNVVIGPASWNSPLHLSELQLPQGDTHIIVTVHYYTPMEFTHQGAAWVSQYAKLSGVTWGDAADVDRLGKNFDGVAAWAKDHHRPIFLGEFGAYDKADIDSRVRYTDAVARAAEARGWAWAYWQFDSDFVAWDMQRDAWVEPIHAALIPKE